MEKTNVNVGSGPSGCNGPGKWKIPIITLSLTGPRQFNEMKDEIEGISAKMLSKELKELEVNELIAREV